MTATTANNFEHAICSASLGEKGWYPNDEAALTTLLNSLFQDPQDTLLSSPTALIIPHAGYRYSGKTAAKAIQHLQGNTYSKIILMGPSHYYPLHQKISIPIASAYQSPLGNYPIDTKSCQALLNTPFFTSVPEIHTKEHSIQIELPLLQHIAINTPIIPLIVGHLQKEDCAAITSILKESIDDNTLLIVSTDFTHYGASFGYLPFEDSIQNNLKNLDMGAVNHLTTLNFDGFCQYIDDTQATICGQDSLKLLLQLLPPDSHAHLLEYTTSGELTQDWSHSVSYVAMAYT